MLGPRLPLGKQFDFASQKGWFFHNHTNRVSVGWWWRADNLGWPATNISFGLRGAVVGFDVHGPAYVVG